MATTDTTTTAAGREGVLDVQSLQGCALRTKGGEHIGIIRGVHVDDSGRIRSFDTQRRWILGHHRAIPADGMELHGDVVIVPDTALAVVEPDVATAPVPGAPTMLAGREGARQRYGGVDVAGSLMGAFVAFALVLLVGGLLAAVFSVDQVRYDTGITSWDEIGSGAFVVGGVTLFVAFLFGGWAAGRISRFDGALNGLLVGVWALVLGAAFAVAGAVFADRYDVIANSSLPSVTVDGVGAAGLVGCLIALAIMFLGGLVGGMWGEARNRRTDRAMFDPVQVAPASRLDGRP